MGASKMSAVAISLLCIVMVQQCLSTVSAIPGHHYHNMTTNFTRIDKQLIGVALNLEYFEASFFLYGAFGEALETYGPSLIGGGPLPIGGQKADLDPETLDVFGQMGLQEVGHLRAIKRNIEEEAFPRPPLDISKGTWAKVFSSALGTDLSPPFDVYNNSVNFYLASYAIPYVGLTGYTGASPMLQGFGAKSLVARLLAVESGQDAVIRTWLYERKDQIVEPYNFTIAYVTDSLSKLRNSLDHGDLDDEGLVVPVELGAEMKTEGNILSADVDSLAYTRTPRQIFSIVYSTGDASKPGGFYPRGGNGTIAKAFLGEAYYPPN